MVTERKKKRRMRMRIGTKDYTQEELLKLGEASAGRKASNQETARRRRAAIKALIDLHRAEYEKLLKQA